jgi:cobaltochelatase CobS
MNAANYDRFGVVVEMRYMNKRQEIEILHNEAQITKADASKIIEFATYVREAFDRNKISDTVSTRALVTAAKLGKVKSNWQAGLQLSFIAKLSRIDREVVNGIAQRVFG